MPSDPFVHLHVASGYSLRHGASHPHLLVERAAEREVWRVEATRGRQHGSGIYDLCFDWASGGWVLLRSHD